jgi:hypothetical protein
MVAVSEFSGGAMESYGLVIYRENELLHDVLQPAAARKQRASLSLALSIVSSSSSSSFWRVCDSPTIPFSLEPCFHCFQGNGSFILLFIFPRHKAPTFVR